MKKPEIIDLIKLDEFSMTSKFLQIANCVIREIEKGNINKNDTLPSINDLSLELFISRDTVSGAISTLKP